MGVTVFTAAQQLHVYIDQPTSILNLMAVLKRHETDGGRETPAVINSEKQFLSSM